MLETKKPKVIIGTLARQFKINEDELTGKRPAIRDLSGGSNGDELPVWK